MAARKKSSKEPQANEVEEVIDDDYPIELLKFGERLLRELQKKLGDSYSQSEAARRTGVSQPTIYNLITKKERKYFRVSSVLKIAKALDISLDVLLLDRPDPWKIAANLRRQGGHRIDEHPARPVPESLPKLRKKRAQQT